MIKRLLHLLIAPRQQDEDIRNREIVLNMLLAGTLLMLALAFCLLLFHWLVQHYQIAATRSLSVLGALLMVGVLYTLSRRGYYRIAAFVLVGLYSLMAAAVIYQWGITIPTGELLMGLVIVLAGILLGPAYSLYVAAGAAVWLLGCQLAAEHGLIHPDWSWTLTQPSFGDALGFCLIFGLIALVSWLFNHQMERSLHRAKRAELALTHQKELLETTVEERTRELQAVQLEKIQQMYRFAELGQLSTALLHDLANHLTTLTLDIEGLEGQTRSRMLQRAKRSIRYIDDMVLRVRDQLHGRVSDRVFSVSSEVDEVVKILNHRAQQAHVVLRWQTAMDRKSLKIYGEPIKFRQLMANLISNGIDAYEGVETERREVLVTADVQKNKVVVTVNDWGKGIPKDQREQLFEPFYSTKKTGMGMGLFIAKQICEEHFRGSIAVNADAEHTAFIVRLKKA
ncbi:MAG TPA: HAMP domain-containing sensor histidine kinase [Bacillota bacterium]|nr:HAMP domain-containing sensor histidine kinase [Bacillota bacterium]